MCVAALGVVVCLAATGLERAPAFSLVSPQPVVMKLRRTCVGCPNYAITLRSDGRLIYEGGDYTRVRGVHVFTVPAEVVMDVLADFTHPDFLELENVYPSPGVAWITLSLSIEMNSISKSVLSEDRYGPAVLLALERKMDDLPGMRSLSGWTR
ncbi:MAG: DUF6438 domain-containing protein [Anaerolineae bacterium]|nr:DUF6438 domain-containing protein [Candidatus Roseilinea sp.]MDW8449518.1 DUF6438 domain-containing protein [Anaerolineae bacterium]